MSSPPRVALMLVRLLVPECWREVVLGDLLEEWHQGRASRARIWSLAVRSIAACLSERLRSISRAPRRQPDRSPALVAVTQDLRHGWRYLRRSPGFTAAAIVTLGLGIGANSAIFSLFNVLTLKPLPYRDPGRVAFLLGWDLETQEMRFNLAAADYNDLGRQLQGFESIAAYRYLSANLTGGDVPERVQAYEVTANAFALLGVTPIIGRVFREDDGLAGAGDVVVLSHGMWQRRFGGDPAIVSRRVTINGEPHEVVGVMPAGFEFPVFNFKGDLWVPWGTSGTERGNPGAAQSVTVIGRLRPDVTYADAQAELDVLMRRLARDYPTTNSAVGVKLVEMGRLDDEQVGFGMTLVQLSVGMVLLLACANVANLLLARAISRRRELAVRGALGASRRRIVQQLLIEAALVALLGGGAGIVIATLALHAIHASLPEMILTTLPNVDEIGVDSTTLAFTLALSILTSFIFGLIPAYRAASPHLHESLKESASAGGSGRTRRLRAALIVGEVALSALLLVAAGLLVRSYTRLLTIDPGFSARGVLTLTMSLPEYRYATPEQQARFFRHVQQRVESLPAVEAAGLVNVLPFSTYDRSSPVTIEGVPSMPGPEPEAAYRVATPQYYRTLKIPVLDGRSFDERDGRNAPPVALVNQAFIRRYLQGRAAVGQRVRLGSPGDPWVTIVGVLGDVRHSDLEAAPRPEIHRPLEQAPTDMMMLAVRGLVPTAPLAEAVRQAITEVDPVQPVYHVKTLERLVGDSALPRSTTAALMVVFGGLALVLAAVGLYGVIAYAVSQQTREFGVRLALGATPLQLVSVVLRSGMLMVGAGIVIGLSAAAVVSRMMSSLLFGVSSSDPVTHAFVVVLLGMTGLVACAVPAWRAASATAVSALRAE